MNRTPVQPGSDDPQGSFRALVEDLALKTEDLGRSLEGVQGLAEEIALAARTGLQPETLVRLQVLDSLTQRLFVLPRILRCLKAAVPENLEMPNAEQLRSFEVIMASYQGSALSDPPDRQDAPGDCEFWNS